MNNRVFWICCSLLVAAVAGFSLSIIKHKRPVTRVASVETVRTYHYPDSLAKQIKGNPHAGKIVYEAYCSHCHAPHPQIPIAAPRVGDSAVWRAMAKLGEDKLLHMTLLGNGAMPARGGCFECDRESIHLAIQYMMRRSGVGGE